MKGASSQRIAVCIPTWKRPVQLRQLLDALAPQLSQLSATVVVIDNDAERSAQSIVQSWSASVGEAVSVEYVCEPRPGVVHARNAAIDAALQSLSDIAWIAFIDDDEIPSEQWIESLLATATSCGADVVTGPVDPVYATEPEAWIRMCGFFDAPVRPTGMRLSKAFTGNLMIRAATLRSTGIRFDERLALSGGEDVLFSRELAESGAAIVWCDEARVSELQPDERLTRRWIMQRAFRVGTTTTFVEFAVRSWFSAFVVTAPIGLYKMLKASVFFPILGWFGAHHRAAYQHLFIYGWGMWRGITGYVYNEYARPSSGADASSKQ